MSAAGQRLGLRLFLEGYEVPVISAQVQIGINAPAVASIQVVPGDKVLELKARTMVHLFFWDYTQDSEPYVDAKNPEAVANFLGTTVEEAQKIIAEDPGKIDAEYDELKGYKLLYSGEVIGITLVKAPTGRQAVLQCSDFSTYWDTTYQFFISYGPSGNFLGSAAAVWAGGAAMFDDLMSGHTAVLGAYIGESPKTPGLTNIKGLMGGIISLLEAMGGVPKHSHGVNDFFTIAELKNHILQQIVAEQEDDTSQNLLRNKAFLNWLSGGMSQLGQLCTFRDMMKLLFKYIYYEVIPNPAAMYVSSTASTTRTKTVTVTKHSFTEENVRIIEKHGRTAQDQSSKAANGLTVFDAREIAEDMYPDLIDIYESESYNLTDNQKSIFRSLYVQLDLIIRPTHHVEKVPDVMDGLGQGPTLYVYPVDGRLVPIPGLPTGAVAELAMLKEKIPYTEERSKLLEKVSHTRTDAEHWGKIANLLDRLFDSVTTRSRKNINVTKAGDLDRLQTQIFRPDCFFAAPPRCNVLFPDQYTQFSFSKNLLQEITRLRLSVSWLFGVNTGGLLSEFHFAPATASIKKVAREQDNAGIRALLPWEKYSGILPKFETIHEVNYVSGRSERRMGIKGNLQGDITNYAQRTANFNYMKYRFAARTCEVSAKFNPFMVCGFPALIIDRPFIFDHTKDKDKLDTALVNLNEERKKTGLSPVQFDDPSDAIRGVARELGAPSQYLGMVVSLSHSVGQEGGSTSAILTHARTHRVTDDDFLDIFSKEMTRKVKDENIVSTVIDAEEYLKSGDRKNLDFIIRATPQNIIQSMALEELKKFQATAANSDEEPPLQTRPAYTPSSSTLDQLAEFGSMIDTLSGPPETALAVDDSKAKGVKKRIPLRGPVAEEQLHGSPRTILVPNPYSPKLKIGDKGPKGGTIVQIECLSDAVIMVPGSELNNRFGPVVKFYTEVADIIQTDDFERAPFVVGPIQLTPTHEATLPGFYSTDDDDIYDGDETRLITRKTTSNRFAAGKPVYMWRKIAIYENAVSKKAAKLVPIEEALRPPWFSPLYSNWFIGDHIYKPFFGTGAIVDKALFLTPSESGGSKATLVGAHRAEQKALQDKLAAAKGNRKETLKILEDSDPGSISDVPDVESSVDALAYIYGEVLRHGLDVHRFVNDYTKRPIATMEEIFGSRDLKYKVTGDKLEKVSGTPGFHSTAILDVGGKLLGLLDNPDANLPRLSTGKGGKFPISRTLDPRPGRMKKVKEYLSEINAGSGSLGVGVEG